MKKTKMIHIQGWKINCPKCGKEIDICYKDLDSNLIGISLQCPYCGTENYYGVIHNIPHPDLILEPAK